MVAGKSPGSWPVPMPEEDTTPGVPPPSLSNPTIPDWRAYGQAEPSLSLVDRLLTIGDTHSPRHHPDAIPFLAAIKAEFAPTKAVHVGDETDMHGLSFHTRDPNLSGASDELRAARKFCADLQELFPSLDIIESNHGSLLYRQAVANGIPHEMVRGYNEVLQVGAGWRWLPELVVNTASGPVHIEHGQKATARNRSRNLGMSVIQGHRHGEAYAEWWDNSVRSMFAMQTGCIIDNRDRGFWYNRNYRVHPVISTGIVIDGDPFVIRMGEAKSGKWDARLRVGKAACA